MYFYKIYGLNIKSDYPFEEAIELSEIPAHIDVEIAEGKIDERISRESDLDHEPGSIIVYRYEPSRGWIRSRGQGCFVMEAGSKITYQLKENHNKLMVNQVFLCAVLPIILIQRGEVAIHGSGILMKEKAIIVSGESGSGKSTLAAKLLKEGGIFMADDTVAIQLKENKVFAQGAYPQQKICLDAVEKKEDLQGEVLLLPPDGGKEKYAVRLKDGFCMEEKPLDSLFIIQVAEVEKVILKEITGSEKIKYLLSSLYKYQTYVQLGMSAEVFRKCIAMANSVKIYVIYRPMQGMTVDKQVEEIKKVLE